MAIVAFDAPIRTPMVPDDIKVNIGHAGQLEEALCCFWFAFNPCSVQVTLVFFYVFLDRSRGVGEKRRHALPLVLVKKRHVTLTPPTVVLLGHFYKAQSTKFPAAG